MRFSKLIVAICLFAGVVFGLGMFAQAEFYKYKDENGAIRFTDDLSEVPEDQRPKLRVYDEPADFGIEPEKPAEKENAEPEDKKGKPDRMTIYKQLREEEAKLMEELEELNKEKANFGEPGSESYNKKVDQFNKKVEEYEKKRAAHNKKADEFRNSEKKTE